MCNQKLWLNSNSTVQNQLIIWKKWLDNGIRTINDNLETNGNFMDIQQAIASWPRHVISSNVKEDENDIRT